MPIGGGVMQGCVAGEVGGLEEGGGGGRVGEEEGEDGGMGGVG